MNDVLPDALRPDWAVPPRIRALASTRLGGVSAAPFDSLNLSASGGDDAATVAENRRLFAAAVGATPRWLSQVHGTRVVRLSSAGSDGGPLEADAAITTDAGVACAVMVADCLPVLFCAADGRAVGAAHAGWRGLASGVLENTVAALRQAAGCAAEDIVAWLGPCIGPRQFEVGADVLQAFGSDVSKPHTAFRRRDRADGSPRWLADLPALARERLQASGLRQISGGSWCTVEDASRFFSFRRDRVTGRMAAAIVIGT